MSASRTILITVHGIRTFGEWQERLKSLVQDANPNIDVKSYRYGYFSVIAFLIPIFRWLAVRSFRNRLREIIRENPGSPITIVCHSFGTHLVAHALRGIKPDELPVIPALILSGSVLRSNFNWRRLRATGKLKLVVNDCGTNDGILVLSQMLVLLTGMAGRVGFYGFTDDFIVNRYFAGGHSHYFRPVGNDPDSFMREWWVPIAALAQAPKPAGALSLGGTLQGVLHAFMRIADPLKGGLYFGLIAILVFFGYVQPRRETALEEGRRQYQAAAGQVGSDRLVSDAVASLARLINAGTFTTERDVARMSDVARFGLQRLLTANEVLATVPAGSIFRWSGGIYLKGDRVLRLDVPPPLFQFRHSDAGVSVLITEKVVEVVEQERQQRQIEFIVFDLKRATVLMRVPINHDGRASREFVVRPLRADRNRILIEFAVREIEGDDSTTYYVGIDLARRTARTSAIREDIDLRFHSNCQNLAWFDDEDNDAKKTISIAPLSYLFEDAIERRTVPRHEDTSKSYSDDLHQDCGTTLEVLGISRLQFPRSVPEQKLFQIVQAPTMENEAAEDACTPDHNLGTDTRVVKDMTSLDLTSMSLIKGTSTSLEQAKSDIQDMGCPQIFSGSKGKQYLATAIAVGQWMYGRVICEMIDERRVGRCGIYPFASEGGGSIWKSAAGDLAVLGDARTETNPGGFTIVELASGTQLAPNDIPPGTVFAAAVDSERHAVMVISDVEGYPGAAEVSAYRLEADEVKLTGRRTFEAPYDGVLTHERGSANKNDAARPRLVFTGGAFVLSMMPDTLIALDVPTPTSWFDQAAGTISSWFVKRQVLPDASIPLRWSVQQLDLGDTVAELTARSGSRILIAQVGSKIRLYSALDGEALTPRIDLAQLNLSCVGRLLSAVIEADESLTFTLEGCRVQRAPPAAAERVPHLVSNLEHYFEIDGVKSNE
ncbi:hypothetical protein ACVIW2_004533 [Bradyrhizobium huanghuaihaiense]|jgi:hypothetical protein|uniref:Blr1564 protein n=5 Tax=Bradyrhizobium TaxID=374 RepID=Q89U55_BRADU|nr:MULTISPECIES: hypothetical protein [Bradyrhizobium]AJA65756.1 hypothetical protein RN69_40030 [Bradyrhizobium japonicum]AND87215.1 hypothetical protein AAV28_04765 [Bradyrhizobium diazoefficiens USDA 110]APO50190.1 hypothetical protein BD122_08140 [Bradyrhizobium diazoefficiens]KGJ66020.1 hypothetical protein BJA5080_02667 [Bradyrhizobium diazoefficiens SEMIA 5080]KGT76962.1 hypothetical protein MA20_25775 [Bradyrhizobium japonicum]